MKKTLCSAACFASALLAAAGPASAEEPPAPVEAPTYTVALGDHLWAISAARLGSGERWVEVYASNLDVLDSPDQIEAGQVLKIPTGPVEVPADLLAGTASTPANPTSNAPAGATRSRPAASSSAGGNLASIRECESSGNYQAVSPGGKYRGAYQFDQRTWESVGGSGDPCRRLARGAGLARPAAAGPAWQQPLDQLRLTRSRDVACTVAPRSGGWPQCIHPSR